MPVENTNMGIYFAKYYGRGRAGPMTPGKKKDIKV